MEKTAGPRQPSLFMSYKGAWIAIALLSGLINVLYLTGSFFMLEVYDRVLPSRSLITLVALAIIALFLYAFQGLFDGIRGRIFARIGTSLDEELSQRVFRHVMAGPLRERPTGDGQQPLRDVEQIRSFLTGGGPSALFDLPWIPLYLMICFAFHAWIGLAALAGAVLLISLTLLTEIYTRRRIRAVAEAAVIRNSITGGAQHNAEVVHALGMASRMAAKWGDANRSYMENQQYISDVAGGFGATTKVLRMVLQSAVLGIGACLVIQGKASAGIMIASSILASRALAPVEQAISNWKGFVAARQGWGRLKDILKNTSGETPVKLPAPRSMLSVECAATGAPGNRSFGIQEVSFRLAAGSGLGVVGPSASGKTTLARMLVGVWPTWRGKVRLDGAALDQWQPEDLGPHIGYMPQDVELFGGSVAQNIARFDPAPESEAVIAAARAANVHDMILRLPDGYETQIGEGGHALSAGQRQRIALARALYGDPFLLVLDEPNSNLDAEGDQALTQAILGVRARGGVVVVIAHRPSALAGVDQMMIMSEGRVHGYGPKDEILGKVLPSSDAARQTPFKVVSG